jgi:hypothetical protein
LWYDFFRHSHLIDFQGVDTCLVDVRNIGSATSDNYTAQKFVGIVGIMKLIFHIHEYFLQARVDYLVDGRQFDRTSV